MPNHGVRTMLLTIGFLVGLVVVFQAIGFSDSPEGDTEFTPSLTAAGAWTIFTFEDVGDARAVGRQRQSMFGEAWYGMVETEVENLGTRAARPPTNTVAKLWFPPANPHEGGVSFETPVHAIAFDYRMDSALDGPTAVFLDPSGIVIARLRLDASDSTVHQSSESREHPEGIHGMQRALFVAPPGLWIARMEFEGAGAVVGHFALDNFAVLDLELIFADGFETGSTDRWDLAVSPSMTPTPHPPSCDDIIIGDIDWDGDYGIKIEPVANTHPTAQLMHKRTDLDWAYSYQSGNSLREAYFAHPGGSVFPYDHYQAPISRNIDIPFQPGQSSSFRANWHSFTFGGGFYPGIIEIRFRFEYPGGGPTCEYTRSIKGQYTPTNTPTITPTMTAAAKPTRTPTPDSE